MPEQYMTYDWWLRHVSGPVALTGRDWADLDVYTINLGIVQSFFYIPGPGLQPPNGARR